VVAAILLLLGVGSARALNIMDLVHDTPATRQRYHLEIVGFSTETVGTGVSESLDSPTGIWLARQRYLEVGEKARADALLSRLAMKRVEQGRRNLIPQAVLLIRESFREMEEKRWERADQLMEYASTLAPDYPPVHMARGYLALRKGFGGVPAFLQGMVEAGGATLRESSHLAVLIGRAAGSSLLLGALVALCWAGALLIRYQGHLRHDLQEYLYGGRRVFTPARRVVLVSLVVAPVIIFASPLWLAALVICGCWAYQEKRERTVSVAVVLLMVAMPLASRLGSRALRFLDNDLNQAIIAVANGSETLDQTGFLENYYQSHLDDPVVAFTLAQHAWRSGDRAVAEKMFRTLTEVGGPLKVEATINLGNIRMSEGDLQGATRLYRDAVAAQPGSATARFNLGQALNLQFQFNEGGEEIKKAIELDKSFISMGTATGAPDNPEKSLASADLPASHFTRQLVAGSLFTMGGEEDLLWRLTLTSVPPLVFPLVLGLIAAGGIGYSSWLAQRGATRRCQKCGRPFCALCTPGAAKSSSCLQCQHIFQVKEGVDSSARVEKMVEINAYQSRRSRLGFILSALLPGSGHVFFGRTPAGVAFIFLSVLLVVLGVGWEGPFTGKYDLVHPWRVLFVKTVLLALVLVYLVNLLTLYRLVRRAK
jgi:tetratricopeptide (TPR) repeat protein